MYLNLDEMQSDLFFKFPLWIGFTSSYLKSKSIILNKINLWKSNKKRFVNKYNNGNLLFNTDTIQIYFTCAILSEKWF